MASSLVRVTRGRKSASELLGRLRAAPEGRAGEAEGGARGGGRFWGWSRSSRHSWGRIKRLGG